jgi:nicotinamide-nucleotide amidase
MSLPERLAEEILGYAGRQEITICTAESCSGGRLSLAFSKAKGASRYFKGGFVTYTKEMKIKVLEVPPNTIHRGTAVCADVAEAMARGAIRCSAATVGISITGVAGPEPDEDGNPVGLVYCAVARSDGSARHVELRCKAEKPEAIVEEACIEALKLLRSFCFSA